MARDYQQMIIQLDARLSAFERSMRRAEQRTDRAAKTIENRLDKMASTVSRRVQLSLGTALGGVGGAFGVRELGRYADAYVVLQNALRTAGLEGEALLTVENQLFSAANRNGVEVTALARVYNRAALAAKELGATQARLNTFVNAISDALRVQGGSTEAARGALLQLSQAIGQDIVRGEEFNSILEGALPIAQAAARGIDRFGGSVAKLRTAIINGEVTSREFFDGIIRAAPALAARAERANLTLGQSFTVLGNQMVRYIGGAAQSSGVTNALASGIRGIAMNLDAIIPALTVIATALGVRWVVAANKARIAMVLLAASLSATSVATSALTAAGRSLLALVGGPMGLALVALAGTVAVFSSRAAAAEERTQRLNTEMETLGIRSRVSADDIDGVADSLENMTADEIRRKLREIREEMDALRGSRFLNFDGGTLEGAASLLESMVSNVVLYTAAEREAAEELAPLVRGLLDGERTAAEVLARLEEIAEAPVSDSVDDLVGALREAILRTGELDEYFRHIERSAGGAAEAIRKAREAEVSGAPSTAEPSKVLVSLIRQYRELGEQRDAFVRGGVEAYRAVEEQQRDYAAAERDAAKAAKEAGEEGSAAYQAVYDATLKATLQQQELAKEVRAAEERRKASERGDTEARRREEALAGLRAEIALNDELIRRFGEGEEALAQIRSSYEALAAAQRLGLTPGDKDFDQFIMDSKTVAAQQRRLDLLEEGEEVTRSLWTVEQQRADTLANLQKLLDANAISQEVYNEAVYRASEEFERQEALIQELADFGERAFDRIGGAITDAFAKGELAALDFQSIVNAVLSEILQQMIKLAIINPLKNAIFGDALGGMLPTVFDLFGGGRSLPTPTSVNTGGFTSINAFPGMASGGPVRAGGAYQVGEHGRELFIPGVGGTIVPNSALSRSGGGNQIVNIITDPDLRVREQRSSTSQGEQLDVIIDRVVARNASTPGRQTFRALEQGGVRPRLPRR